MPRLSRVTSVDRSGAWGALKQRFAGWTVYLFTADLGVPKMLRGVRLLLLDLVADTAVLVLFIALAPILLLLLAVAFGPWVALGLCTSDAGQVGVPASWLRWYRPPAYSEADIQQLNCHGTVDVLPTSPGGGLLHTAVCDST